MLSLVVPSYNNLRHLKNLFASYENNTKPGEVELIIIDDCSIDGTQEWMESIFVSHPLSFEYNQIQCIYSKKRVGHTVLYDTGFERATNDFVGILHADMYIAPNYVENMMKHAKKGTVVCATRIEPPLHPPQPVVKIIKDFGLDFDTLDIDAYEKFAIAQAKIDKDKTSTGMFAPWMLHKEDYFKCNGHDHNFAPFPYEDSDIFQRWMLGGLELMQSRDAFVYHLTCRGHKWTKEIGVYDDEFDGFEVKARRNWLRKWGSWIENDQEQRPIIYPRYDIGFVIDNCDSQKIYELEPWCNNMYGDFVGHKGFHINKYIKTEQKTTLYDLSKKFHTRYVKPTNDVVVEFDVEKLREDDFNILMNLHKIIQDSGQVGKFKIGIFNITIHRMVNQISHLKHAFKLSEEYL
jgi:glycosyltransferase involved in cell wall biosynthesis